MSLSIASALFTVTQQRVLGLLYGQPERSFHVRDIIRQTRLGRGTVQRLLEKLDASGIVQREVKGRQVFYSANSECPVFAELRGLISKTSGIADQIAAALQPLARSIKVAFIYGSVARGKERADSDIDLMVIGAVSLRQLAPHINELQSTLNRAINPVTYSPAEYSEKLRDGHHFLTSLQSEPKIFLIGGKDEFSRLG